MNGSTQRTNQNSASPLMRANGPLAASHSSRPASTGMIHSLTASLRSIQLQNNNTLGNAISQLEAIGDIQNELVNARSAHAQVSRDLRAASEQSAAQGSQLQQTRSELTSVNMMLHGAREQMMYLEKKIETIGAEVAAREQQAAAVRDADAKKQIDALSSALDMANARILELNKNMNSVLEATAGIYILRSANPATDILKASSSSLQDLDQWLPSTIAKTESPEDTIDAMSVNTIKPDEPTINVSSKKIDPSTQQSYNLPTQSREEIAQLVKTCFQAKNDGKDQILSRLKSLRDEFEKVLNVAQTSVSQTSALEGALEIIRGFQLQPAPLVSNPLLNVDGEIEMDEERTEAARNFRQTATHTLTPSKPPTMIRPPNASPINLPSQPSTPSLPSFTPASRSTSPRRKRPRTSTTGDSQESLPRNDELHAFVKLVNTAYEIRKLGNNPNGQPEPSQLVCKACETRHKQQPEYPITSFDYDQAGKIAVPSLALAEPTRKLVNPWVKHIQERHQKLYVHFIGTFTNHLIGRRPSTAPSV